VVVAVAGAAVTAAVVVIAVAAAATAAVVADTGNPAGKENLNIPEWVPKGIHLFASILIVSCEIL